MQIIIYKSNGKCKSETYTDTQKIKRNEYKQSIKVIRSQGKRTKKNGTENNYKNNQKAVNKMALSNTSINNYFKCK